MTFYIAVDGPGGSGKTHFSELLAEELGAPALHLDDYGDDFKPFIGIPKLVDAIRKQKANVVVFEGIGVFSSEFDEFKPFRIFVSPPEYVRAARVAGRDVPRDGRTADDWEKIFQIWLIAEREYFTDEVRARADLTFTDSGATEVTSTLESLGFTRT